MGFDVVIAERIRRSLSAKKVVVEKKMFGGLCFMVNGYMCCGVQGGDLMLRVGAEQYEKALKRPNTRPMDFTGNPLRGFVYISPKGLKTGRQLDGWLSIALAHAESLPTRPRKKQKIKGNMK